MRVFNLIFAIAIATLCISCNTSSAEPMPLNTVSALPNTSPAPVPIAHPLPHPTPQVPTGYPTPGQFPLPGQLQQPGQPVAPTPYTPAPVTGAQAAISPSPLNTAAAQNAAAMPQPVDTPINTAVIGTSARPVILTPLIPVPDVSDDAQTIQTSGKNKQHGGKQTNNTNHSSNTITSKQIENSTLFLPNLQGNYTCTCRAPVLDPNPITVNCRITKNPKGQLVLRSNKSAPNYVDGIIINQKALNFGLNGACKINTRLFPFKAVVRRTLRSKTYKGTGKMIHGDVHKCTLTIKKK